jgi:hypothetical protein
MPKYLKEKAMHKPLIPLLLILQVKLDYMHPQGRDFF